MKPQNKPLYFIIILALTITITRAIVYYIVNPNIMIKDFQLHHFYSGIILLTTAALISAFSKKKSTLNLTFYAVSVAFIIDELEYFLKGFGGLEQYFSTLHSTIILTFNIILITLYFNIKQKNKKCSTTYLN